MGRGRHIGLCQVDGSLPNLALMRISAWHKAQGDSVEWFMPLMKYDRVYASKIFTFTPDDPYLPADAVRGGTGYDPHTCLPPEVEAMRPDYTIYPQFTEAYGFLTRGCPNKCPWCVVPEKEGGILVETDIEQVCNTNTGFRRKVILMDNNFIAAPFDFISEQVEKMRRLKLRVDFNQGTDARRYDERTAAVMAKVPWMRHPRMSCDTDAAQPHVLRAVRLLREFGWKGEVFVYILTKNGEVESALWRIATLCAADSGIVPFVMPYRSLTDNSIAPSPGVKSLARWCNRQWIRKSCPYSEYTRRAV